MGDPQMTSELIKTRDVILEVIEDLCQKENLQASFSQCGRAFFIVGAGAFIGGLVAGPIGIFLGGTATAATETFISWGKFKPVVTIIKEDLSPELKDKLITEVRDHLNTICATDTITILAILSNQDSLKTMVLNTIVNFLKTEMKLRINSA